MCNGLEKCALLLLLLCLASSSSSASSPASSNAAKFLLPLWIFLSAYVSSSFSSSVSSLISLRPTSPPFPLTLASYLSLGLPRSGNTIAVLRRRSRLRQPVSRDLELLFPGANDFKTPHFCPLNDYGILWQQQQQQPAHRVTSL